MAPRAGLLFGLALAAAAASTGALARLQTEPAGAGREVCRGVFLDQVDAEVVGPKSVTVGTIYDANGRKSRNQPKQTLSTGETWIRVTALVVNGRAEPMVMPPLLITQKDGAGRALKVDEAAVNEGRAVPPGEKVRFFYRVRAAGDERSATARVSVEPSRVDAVGRMCAKVAER